MGIIYIIKNLINHKIYIGQSKTTMEKRWKSHLSSYKSFINNKKGKNSALYGAFDKYGIDNFAIFCYKKVDDDKLDEEEIFYIKTFSSLSPIGYNIRKGGAGGGAYSEEGREKMRLAKLGPKNHNYGKPRSDDFKKLMKEKKSGEKHHYYGKTLNKDHLEKLSKSHKKNELSKGLPMYMVYINAVPKYHKSDGYAIVNHPKLKNKYFTSGKLSLEEKFKLAQTYYQTIE